MWIRTTNTDSDGEPVTERLDRPEFSKPIEFSDNGKANVAREDGERAVAVYDSVEPVSDDTDDENGDTDADSDADSDDTGDEGDDTSGE